MAGTHNLARAGDSLILNVSETLAASGCVCVCMCACVGVRCPPLLVGAAAAAPPAAGVPCRSCPLPAPRVWGHCRGASLVLPLAEPGCAPEPC